MKWIKKDYKGNPQIWYSGDVIEKYKHALINIKRFINQPIPINKRLYHDIMQEIKSTESEDYKHEK